MTRARKATDEVNQSYELVLCRGVSGDCLYLNDFRLVGPKPWGGGAVIGKWSVTAQDLELAIPGLTITPTK